MNIHPDVVKAYKKTLDADSKHADHGTSITKRSATRAANTLSKKIKQHHPDLDMKGNIALRTKLQNMDEGTTSDLIKKSHSKRGKPGTLKAKIDGPITKAKVRALKNRPGATTLDKKQANFYLNMQEDVAATSTASIPNPAKTAMGPRPKLIYMYDRRRKKDQPPVLLKRFRKYMENRDG